MARLQLLKSFFLLKDVSYFWVSKVLSQVASGIINIKSSTLDNICTFFANCELVSTNDVFLLGY